MMKRNIVLVGMMGSGKSHIGRKLAQRLGWQFVDTDRRIERAMGMTIAEFYASAGEKVFREREINVLQQVSRYHEAVISFGGNFPMNVGTYRILHRHGFIVALLSEPFRVEERVSRHIGKRPTVDYDNLHDFVHTMMKQWEEVYPYCDCVIDTTRGGASQIVESIVHKINERHVQFIAREKKENDVK
ncbi:shikimate kinase [Megasphaera sp.]|uniref:shikimate kinase n=1 Tax=Megasphaera sp. TaxID=2023260 RepID=UPI0025FA0FC5|nr:shikimate kinase [uncultured Megasphaera sp.]